MTELAEELKKLRYGLEGGATDEDFVAGVMSACRDTEVVSAPRRRLGAWAVAVAAAVAASAAIALSPWLSQPAPRATEVVAARGLTEGTRATVQAFVGHAPPGAAAPLLEGARLKPGDGILVRYSNPGADAAHLMVFALDERGSVHWLHPAYLDARTNPTSLPLSTHVREQVLPEVAEPEDAAPGLLRVYAVLSRAPLDVKTVEHKLESSGRSPVELFSEAEVEEWRCTWAP